MFGDPKVAPGSSAAKSVCIEHWSDKGFDYTVFIRHAVNEFFFEGRRRVGNGRHKYFPEIDCAITSIGDYDHATEFLQRTLAAYKCPQTAIDDAISRVREWK